MVMETSFGDSLCSSPLKALLLLFMAFFCGSDSAAAPAIFIFGDSLVDNGNNNFIPSIARANYFPYGIDLGAPTGRFCNGLTVVDFAARHLGMKFPPPYLSLSAKSSKMLRGINYASASAGILDETGRHYGSRIPFNKQIELFAKTVDEQLPIMILDPKALSEFLSSSLFIVNIGSNDYINNYLLPDLYPSSSTYSGKQFAKLLINNLVQQIKTIYSIGARKLLLAGLGPLGCIPSQLSMGNITSGCVNHVNELVKQFNKFLIPAIVRLNSTLPGSFFVHQNTYDTFFNMIQTPSKYGFSVSDQACCGNGRYGGELTCLPLQTACSARDQYIFWDPFHPTQAANAIIARKCLTSTDGDCFPISVNQLAEL